MLGLLFAGCARTQFAGGSPPWGRELAAVVLFECIILWPVAIYLYFVFPDWSWMYFVDPHRLPGGMVLLVLLAYLATLLGGYFIGWALLRSHRDKALLGALGGASLLIGLFALVFRARLLTVGTLREFNAGRALSVADTKLLWAMLVITPGVFAAVVVVAVALWEEGKRFRS
jgi:hypothetical protein